MKKINLQMVAKYLGYCIAIIFLVLWGLAKLQNNKLSDTNQLQAVQLMEQTDSTKIYKSKAGDYYAKFQAVGVEKENIKKALDIMGYTNKQLKEKNIKQGDVISALELKVKVMGEIIANVKDSVIHDTIPGKPDIIIQKIDWTNKYLSLNGVIRDKIFTASYLYKTDLSLFTEKKGKSYVVTAYSNDPNAKITNGSQIIVTPKVSFFERIKEWGIVAVIVGASFAIFK